MALVIKQVIVKAIFPGGREVNGWRKAPPNNTTDAFQVWASEKADGSEETCYLVNPSLAESVELITHYEKRDYGK